MERMGTPFENRFLKGCISNVVWASFFVKFDPIQEFLTKYNRISYIISFLTQEGNVYMTAYDKKVLFFSGAFLN